MSAVRQFWQGKRVFITGHTGFKGTWLGLWLRSFGAEVVGYSDNMPTTPAMYRLCGLEYDMQWHRGDVRDVGRLQQAIRAAKPDIVFHLAAQPLVRRSYIAPAETFSINVTGTASVLNAIKLQPSVRAAVVVTSDKCYADQGAALGCKETDPLGGADPYSASKACAELVVDSYRRSYFGSASSGGRTDGSREAWATPAEPASIATARAGNVIGGGDFAADRLVPDCIRAAQGGGSMLLRRPDAIRPWQHVLEPLAGYIRLAERLHADGGAYAEAWNFGPNADQEMTVREMACRLAARLHAPMPIAPYDSAKPEGPYETAILRLDSAKARARLGWAPIWPTAEAIERTAEWYEQWFRGASVREITMRQIRQYETDANAAEAMHGSGGQGDGEEG